MRSASATSVLSSTPRDRRLPKAFAGTNLPASSMSRKDIMGFCPTGEFSQYSPRRVVAFSVRNSSVKLFKKSHLARPWDAFRALDGLETDAVLSKFAGFKKANLDKTEHGYLI